MTQQINLFNPLFLKQRKYFSALTMLQGLAMVVFAVGAFYAWAFMKQLALDQQVAENEAAFKHQTQQLNTISAGLPQAQSEARIEREMKEFETEVAAREGVLRRLDGGNPRGQAAYSDYLRALARQMVSGVWLTAVHISESGEDFRLTGRSTQAELIPQLVRNFRREPLLRGRLFESLGMKRVVPQVAPAIAGAPAAKVIPPYVEFNLASRPRQEDGIAATESQARSAPPPGAETTPQAGSGPAVQGDSPVPPAVGNTTVKPS